MRVSGLSKSSGKADKHESKPVVGYNADADSTLTPAKGEKRKATDDGMRWVQPLLPGRGGLAFGLDLEADEMTIGFPFMVYFRDTPYMMPRFPRKLLAFWLDCKPRRCSPQHANLGV
jgi:hypothetical protein